MKALGKYSMANSKHWIYLANGVLISVLDAKCIFSKFNICLYGLILKSADFVVDILTRLK